MINKPSGMSQLDWLWTNYGGKQISNELSNIASDEVILTEKTVIDYITKQIATVDTSLRVNSYEQDDNLVIEIINSKGVVISRTSFLKGTHITKFDIYISTQEEVDKGFLQKVGNPYLLLQDSLGKEYYVDLSNLNYKGQETESLSIVVEDRKIAGLIKINNPITEKSVDIKSTPDGIKAELVIDSDSNSAITIEKGKNGISCHHRWNGTDNEIKFQFLTMNEYLTLPQIDYGTLYFITDLPCIYFRKIKYASSTALIDYITKDEAQELFNQANLEVIQDVSKLKYDLEVINAYVDGVRSDISNLQEIKVDKIEGSTLISEAKLQLIDNLNDRLTNLEETYIDEIENKINQSLNWEILN